MASAGKLASVSGKNFDAVFYPGGHGPLWDLAEDADSIKLIEAMSVAGKTIAAVCHGPAVLRHAKAADGPPLVKGKQGPGFPKRGEAAVQLTDIGPLPVGGMLVKNGGLYSKGADWQPYVLTDGKLTTGQNPASSAAAAHAVLEQLKNG